MSQEDRVEWDPQDPVFERMRYSARMLRRNRRAGIPPPRYRLLSHILRGPRYNFRAPVTRRRTSSTSYQYAGMRQRTYPWIPDYLNIPQHVWHGVGRRVPRHPRREEALRLLAFHEARRRLMRPALIPGDQVPDPEPMATFTDPGTGRRYTWIGRERFDL